MSTIKQEADGSCRWDCSIDKDFHRRSGTLALWGILFICVFVFIIFLMASGGRRSAEDIRIPLIVIGVLLIVTLPLIFLWNSASDPHEQYEMTEEYVKSGYGKAAIYSEFKKIKELTVTEKYIEIAGRYKNNRIYVPEEDMEFVRGFILSRIPSDAVVRKQ